MSSVQLGKLSHSSKEGSEKKQHKDRFFWYTEKDCEIVIKALKRRKFFYNYKLYKYSEFILRYVNSV